MIMDISRNAQVSEETARQRIVEMLGGFQSAPRSTGRGRGAHRLPIIERAAYISGVDYVIRRRHDTDRGIRICAPAFATHKLHT